MDYYPDPSTTDAPRPSNARNDARLRQIERACRRRIAIETEEYHDSLATCHFQTQSPLFASLPREIRDLVWAFVTAPVEEEGERYAENEYYCRPGHRAPHKTHTSLLRTCRRVWLEANALPMLQAEHCFWYYRAAPDARTPEWMASLTATNRRNFGHLHLFAQMFAIERLGPARGELRRFFLETPEAAGDFQPRMLHVTVRHTDWWFWEYDEPLRFADHWLQALLDSRDLRSTQTLELELETLDCKVDQLMPIVERLKRLSSEEYATHTVDGQPVSAKFVLAREPQTSHWTGPADLDGDTFDPYQGKSTLKYHIVTLTWRLCFPTLPRANVAELRRAPRIDAPEPTQVEDVPRGDETLPLRPRASWYYHRPFPPGGPSDVRWMNKLVRMRHKRRDPSYRSRDEEAAHKWFVARSAQRYLWALQKWQEDEVLAAARERFDAGMAGVRREQWEARWEREGSLLKFE